MRAILILYMVAPQAQGGLSISTRQSAYIYGFYTMLVYLSAIPGGIIADRWLGLRKSIFLGGLIIAAGHFTMVIDSRLCFFGGLGLIIIGTGLLKPNISTMVGSLYAQDDPRRDAGFSIFYMGINLGASIAPIICGFLAQSEWFRLLLTSHGLPLSLSWHLGFACAGLGMCLGLMHFASRHKLLDALQPASLSNLSPRKHPLSKDEKAKLIATLILFLFNTLFWAIYEQGGSSLNLFAENYVANSVWGFSFPASWLQASQPVFVILLAPVFSAVWLKLDKRQPTSPVKFALGLLFLGAAIAVMIPAANLATVNKVSALFLLAVYLIETLGELCLSPVGLSTVTKLAPRGYQSLTMGGWFCSTALGNLLAGYLAGLFSDDTKAMSLIFGYMALMALLAAVVLFSLRRKIQNLMGQEQ